MTDVLAAIVPVFAVIALGALLRRRHWVADGFWTPAEAITFNVLFPALLFTSTARADLGGAEVLPMWAAIFVGFVAVAALAVPVGRMLGLGHPAQASVVQGAVRGNAYVGFAVAYASFGDAGLSLMGVAVILVAPLINAIGVVAHIVLVPGADGAKKGVGTMAVEVAKNPLVLACVLGGALNASGLGLPPLVEPFLDILARAALPLGLLAVGAGLDLHAARRAWSAVGGAAAMKLILLPAAVWTLCAALNVDVASMQAAMIWAAAPVSGTSYVVSRRMGGDAPLMAGIITATTLAGAATLPVWIALIS